MNKKIEFEEFITSVPEEDQDFVKELHESLMEFGLKIEIKAARSGYVVSYILDKKTVANYVFRKKGMIVRIYGANVNAYSGILDTLPDGMIKTIQDAPVCKRMLNPDACNPKCSMGYDFWLKGEHYQKCRNGAFMFLVCAENNPFIKQLLLSEIKARQNFFG